MVDLKTYMQECSRLVDQALKGVIPLVTVHPQRLHEAMHYSLFAGGKRIRPLLCFASAEACGGTRQEVLGLACAMEMIHTFSLIHDDLPAMDNDDLRRGHPTNHKVYGEATAILAGDALMTQAFVVLSRLLPKKPLRALEIIQDIALATGSQGMVGGQVVDMESEGKQLSLGELENLHSLKTGRLITVSVVAGAKAVSEDPHKISALEEYGKAIGLAFQIADDLLDIEGGSEIGKTVGSDLSNHKATYPSLLGLDGARQKARHLVGQAKKAVQGLGPQADALDAIATYIIERKK